MRTLVVLLFVGGVAHADVFDQPYHERKWHLGFEAMTDFPLYVGAQVWAELPHRIRLTMSSGEMPTAYLDTINAIATSAGAYDQKTAAFISELLDHSATWRLHIGWRPWKRRGAYIEGGFGIITLQKGLAVAEVISLATSFPVPQEPNVGFGYTVDTVVETLGVEVGWIWYPWRDLSLRVALAFAGPVGAQVSISPNFASTLQRPFTRFAESYAEELIEKYLLVPTVGIGVGWRLF
jgi:hypothetical protein